MKITKQTILSAGAITAFSLSLAIGLSANVDQTSQQQGAALQGTHPPTQYGTPGERAAGAHRESVTDGATIEREWQPQEFGQPAQERQVQQQRSTRQETTRFKEQRSQTGQQQQFQQRDEFAQTQHGKEHRATDLLEKRVENNEGDRLGSVEDLIIDVDSGDLEFVVVSAGGILGLGGDLRAVPPHALQVSGENRLILDISRDRWEKAPTIERDEIAQLGQGQRSQEIRSFYGQQGGSTRQFGARGDQSDLQESQQQIETQQEWGARERQEGTEPAIELEQDSGSSQQREQGHRTAEPHRLPGDPYGRPAEPQPLPQDRSDVQDEFQQQGQMQQEQQEFGARVREEPRRPAAEVDASPGEEWRAEAFEDDLARAEQRREQQVIQYGAPERRDTRTTTRVDRMEMQADRGGPSLNNPRLVHSNRGTDKSAENVLFGAREPQRHEMRERTYGQPHYREEVQEESSVQQREWGAPEQRAEREWQQRSTRQQQQVGAATRQQQTEQRFQQQDQMRQQAQTGQQTQGGQGNLKMASDLIGRKVTDQQQENLGEISDFLVDLEQGRVSHTLVELDDEADQFAVPVHQLQLGEQQDRAILRADRQQLQQAPSYEQRAAGEQREQIFRYEEQRKTRREFGAPLRDKEDQEVLSDPQPDLQDEADADLQEEASLQDPAEENAQTTTEFGARDRSSVEVEESSEAEAAEDIQDEDEDERTQ